MKDNIQVDFNVIGSVEPGNYDWTPDGTPKTGIVDLTPRLVIGPERWMEAFRTGAADPLSVGDLLGYGVHDGTFTTKGARSFGRAQVSWGKVSGLFLLDCTLDIGKLLKAAGGVEPYEKVMIGILVGMIGHPMLLTYDGDRKPYCWQRATVTARSSFFDASVSLRQGTDPDKGFFDGLEAFLCWVCEREAKC